MEKESNSGMIFIIILGIASLVAVMVMIAKTGKVK